MLVGIWNTIFSTIIVVKVVVIVEPNSIPPILHRHRRPHHLHPMHHLIEATSVKASLVLSIKDHIPRSKLIFNFTEDTLHKMSSTCIVPISMNMFKSWIWLSKTRYESLKCEIHNFYQNFALRPIPLKNSANSRNPLIDPFENPILTCSEKFVPPLKEKFSSYIFRSDAILSSPSSNCFKFWKWFESDSFDGALLHNVFQVSVPSRTKMKLSEGARRILKCPNAGGSSEWSEAISFECLQAMIGPSLKLLLTEMEIEYKPMSKIMDFSVSIKGKPMGVSVTRMINFRDLKKKYKGIFTFQAVRDLLYKKLYGALLSSQRVCDHHRWEKQCLHIFTTSQTVSEAVITEYYKLDQIFRQNTLVIVTHFKNADWIF